MSYIGSTPTTQSFISGTDYFNGDGSTTAFTLSRSVVSVNDIEVVINNVVQQPNTAYTISGTTITFTSAPSSGSSNIYVRYLSTTLLSVQPVPGSVGISSFSATGTPSSSTYLRGDNTWSTVTGGTVTSVSGTGTVSGLTLSGTVTSSGSLTLGGTLALPTGTVKQVVSVNDTTQYVFNSGSANQTTYYNITGLVATITPSSSSNKIMLMANITAGQANNTYNAFFRATRNGTVIGVGVAGGYPGTSTTAMRTSDGGEIGTNLIMYLDSPGTTSAVTYQIQICNAGGSGSPSYVNRPQNASTGWEQSGASSITLMEIVG